MDRINDVGLKVESIFYALIKFFAKELAPILIGALIFISVTLMAGVEGDFGFTFLLVSIGLLAVAALIAAVVYLVESYDG